MGRDTRYRYATTRPAANRLPGLLTACALLLAPVTGLAQERIVGGPGGGCIAGAVELPAEGPGYRTIRMSRSWFWGAPETIAAVQLLARQAHAAGLPDLYVNDISLPHGGPFPGIHASHMLGLDADIWLDVRPKPSQTPAQREAVQVEPLVTPDGRAIEPALWSPGVMTLIRLAAGLPGIDRILVNPAIKRQLCRDAGPDRAFLARIRPWYGHTAHMHLHFRCPPGQSECVDQAPPPGTEGCDASLQWWFDQLDLPPKPPGPPAVPVRLPSACAGILPRQ